MMIFVRNKSNAIKLSLFPILLFARYNSISIVSDWSINIYQKTISPLQGSHVCNFSPSCSQFSKEAIQHYGLFKGILMTSDRLKRCSPFAWSYLGSYYEGVKEGRLIDPVETNHKPQTQKTEIRNPETKFPMSFADYLFNNGDYLRAIGEYQRLIFTTQDSSLKIYAQFRIGESFLRLGDFNNGLKTFRKLNDFSNQKDLINYGIARCHLGLGNFDETRKTLTFIQDTGLLLGKNILTGWSYFEEKDFKNGALVFKNFSDTILKSLERFDGSLIKYRSPILSSVFSTLLPGSGQIYSGRVGDGLFTFLTTLSTSIISYYYYKHKEYDPSQIKFGIFAGLTLFFWTGNIYGANRSARDFNKLQIKNYLTAVRDRLTTTDLTPDYYHYLFNK